MDTRTERTTLINLVTLSFTRAIAWARVLLSPHRSADAPRSDLFAKRGMTTAGLAAVNVALVAVLVSAPPAAQAQDIPAIRVCSWCYESYERWNNRWVHATQELKDGHWERVDGMTFSHRRPDRRYHGSCWQAHPDAACCDPDDEAEDGVD